MIEMRKMKENIHAVFEDTSLLMKDMNDMDEDAVDFPDSVRTIVQKYNQSGTPMQDATKGPAFA